MGWRDWVGRMVVVLGGWKWVKTQYQNHMNSLPNGTGTSPSLISLMLSQQTFRLKIITVGCKAVVNYSAENNTSPISTGPFPELGNGSLAIIIVREMSIDSVPIILAP